MPNKSLYRKRTKIVVTIGPASGSPAVMEKLIRAGMNVARLNLSHGTPDLHTRYIQMVRRASQKLGVGVAILIDLPGPKYRVGQLKGDSVILEKGAKLVLTPEDVMGDAGLVPVKLPGLTKDVKAGDTVMLDDGAIELKVLGKGAGGVRAQVTVGGRLTSGRGLVVPGSRISAPFISDALRDSIRFALGERPDYLALSFVSRGADVKEVRGILAEHGADIPLISKIERAEAVESFEAILKASDGVMVARGDLGVEIPLEKVPLVQKDIIRQCNRAGKPVITATQMLESMVDAARPTRAEVTDVANAILDGTDATMLSQETSIGKYPVEAVATMARIAQETEKHLGYGPMLTERNCWLGSEVDELISYSACHIAASVGAVAIVAFTQSGSTARRVSKYRPQVPILAITPSESVRGRLLLHWGVYPLLIAGMASVSDLFATGARLAKEQGLARSGDLVVITGGIPIGVAGSTNMLKVERVE